MEVLTPEVMPAAVLPAAAVVPIETGLSKDSESSLRTKFQPQFDAIARWRTQAEAIKVTDVNDIRGMKVARESRLAVREIRLEVEKTRKDLKEDALRTGRAIDAVANLLKAAIEPIESHLQEQEEYAMRIRSKQIAELTQKRTQEVTEAEGNPLFLKLGEMPEADYAVMLQGLKDAKAARKVAAEKAEADRIAKEKAAAEAIEAQRLENQRLKAEAARQAQELAAERQRQAEEAKRLEAERKAEVARLKADQDEKDRIAREEQAAIEAAAEVQRKTDEALVKAAKEAQEKAEAELAARQKAEADALAERLKAEAEEQERLFQQQQALVRAPDADKLRKLAADFKALPIPEMGTEAGQTAIKFAKIHIDNLSLWLEGMANGLAVGLPVNKP